MDMKTKGGVFAMFARVYVCTASLSDGRERGKNNEESRPTTGRGTPATDVMEGVIANIRHYNMGFNSVY